MKKQRKKSHNIRATDEEWQKIKTNSIASGFGGNISAFLRFLGMNWKK